MNVLALLGSPRRRGNTAALLGALLEALAETGSHEVREVFLHGRDIRPCRHCDSCLHPRAGRRPRKGHFCVIEDDMRRLYRRFIEADLVIFATPVYWWSVSAQLKLFVDRLYALNVEEHPELFENKRIALLFTHQASEPCSGAELAAAMFREIAAYTGMRVVGDLRCSSADRHARDCPEKLEEARALGRVLGAARGPLRS